MPIPIVCVRLHGFKTRPFVAISIGGSKFQNGLDAAGSNQTKWLFTRLRNRFAAASRETIEKAFLHHKAPDHA